MTNTLLLRSAARSGPGTGLLLGLGLLLLLTSCADERAQTMTGVAGTWNQLRAEGDKDHTIALDGAQRIGFLSLGDQQVVIALDGLPRQVAAPRSIAVDPATRSGCITLENGVQLFLSSGETVLARTVGAEVLAVPVGYLDVDIEGVRSGPDAPPVIVHQRLWSEQALQSPVRLHAVAQAAQTAQSIPATDQVTNALTPDDTLRVQVAALAVPELEHAAGDLLRARAQGETPARLSAIVDRSTLAVRRDLLARLLLAGSGSDPSQTAATVGEVARRQRALAAFSAIVAYWLMQS